MQGNKSKARKKEEPAAGAVAAGDGTKGVSRRGFITKAAVGAVALAGTAELAKQVASSVRVQSAQQRYDQDVQAGDRAMSEWEYVVMSDQEKQDMVQGLIENHKKST